MSGLTGVSCFFQIGKLQFPYLKILFGGSGLGATSFVFSGQLFLFRVEGGPFAFPIGVESSVFLIYFHQRKL